MIRKIVFDKTHEQLVSRGRKNSSPFSRAEITECERRARDVSTGKVKALTLGEIRALGILPGRSNGHDR
jgi:hypothetical protein